MSPPLIKLVFAKWQWLRSQRMLGKDQKPRELSLVLEILSVLNFRHLHLREEVEVNQSCQMSECWVHPPSLVVYHKPSNIFLDRIGPGNRYYWGGKGEDMPLLCAL